MIPMSGRGRIDTLLMVLGRFLLYSSETNIVSCSWSIGLAFRCNHRTLVLVLVLLSNFFNSSFRYGEDIIVQFGGPLVGERM